MIRVRHLQYSYPETGKPALGDVSFDVEAGETIGIVGASKAGKSTLCYALMGLVPHFFHGQHEGVVQVHGMDVPVTPVGALSEHVGLVFQNPVHQFSGAKLTVEDEIAFGMENLGVDAATMQERVTWVSGLMGIEDLLDRNPFHLSGGQMQRAAIASVLALKPRVLILDEPTSQLDPQGTADVFEAISMLKHVGVTTVVAEHKTELLAEFCDRILVLVEGKLTRLGSPEAVFSDPDALQWGVEIPRYSQVCRRLDAASEVVPATYKGAVERLKAQ